jgi:hypothetical protein
VEAPRVDVEFSWDYYQGFTAFALGHEGQSQEDVQRLFAEALSYGWNTARICSETEFWNGPGYPTKPRDKGRLQELLDTIARIPGAQVLLIGDCTLKRQVPLSVTEDWARQVADIAKDYANVAIETHNEFDNCAGRSDWGGLARNCPGKQDVRRHIEIYMAAGIQYVTADDSICHGRDEAKTYSFRLSNIGARPADFHPCRDKGREPWDPSIDFLQKIAYYNGDFVLSETVAFMDYSGRCDGLRTCDKERINRYINNCASVPECRFTYHSENLLAGESPSWWPIAR